ncbi:MAG: DUF58 domain-containing protein [Verrucomicrobiota bacterium]
MPQILKQPRWSFWKFREVYQVEATGDLVRVRESTADFYRSTAPEEFEFTADGFQFHRSSGWRGLVSISELKLRHEVTATFRATGATVLVTVAYRVKYPAPLPNLHFRPSHFYLEAKALETKLNQNRGYRTLSPGVTEATPIRQFRRFSPVNIALWMFYRAYRIATWSTYWTKRRFTIIGQSVVGATLVAMFASLDADSAVGYQAFVPLAVILLLGFLFRFGFRGEFQVERRLPRLATVGQSIWYSVVVKNLSRHRQAGLNLIEDLTDPRPRFKQWREYKLDEDRHVRPFRFDNRRFRSPFKFAVTKEADVPTLRPQQEVEVRVELTPIRRGLVRFDGVTFARPDPLGVYRALRSQPVPQSLLILPRRYEVPPVALPGQMKYQQGGVAMASHIGQSEEFVALREYRRGDPPRHIHWRSWAKAGKPIVKEYEDEFFVRHALVLDTFTARPYSDAFEEAVSVAASFACTVLAQESLLDLLFVGAEAYAFTAGRGLAHADQMLEILAAVQPCRNRTFEQLEGLVLDHVQNVSGCICVLLAWDDARQQLVKKLRLLGVPLRVFVIRPAGETERLLPGPMYDAPEQFHQLEIGQIGEQLANLK